MGKREIALNKQTSPFPTVFLKVIKTQDCVVQQSYKYRKLSEWIISHGAKKCLFQPNVSFARVSTLPFSSLYTHFNTLKKKKPRKTLWKNVKLLKMSNFTFFHHVFYATGILKTFNSHISVTVCSFFEFQTVSKWGIREWVKKNPTFLPCHYFVFCTACIRNISL